MKSEPLRTYGYNLPHTALEDCLARAGNGGLSSLEINIPRGIAPADIFPPARIDAVGKLRDAANATLSFHVPFKTDVSDLIPPIRNANIKYLSGCIATAAALGIRLITIHLGNFYWFPVEQRTRRKALERFTENIGGLLEECAGHGIRLAMENVVPLPHWSEYRHLGDSREDFHYIFSQVESAHLGMCLDTGHANLGGGVLPYIEELGEHLFNVHIHDNHGNDDSHLMVGEGSIDWDAAVRAFLAAGFNGPFISECRNADPAQAAATMERLFYNASPVKS